MMVFRAGIHKMLVRIANREEPDQNASLKADLGLPCRSRPFGQALVFKIFEHLTYTNKLLPTYPSLKPPSRKLQTKYFLSMT